LYPKVKLNTNVSSTYPSAPNGSAHDIFNSLVSSGHFGDQNLDAEVEDDDFLGETSSAFTSGPDLEFDDNYETYQDLDDSFHAAKGLELDQLDSANASIISPPKDFKAVIVKHRFVTLSWEEPEQKAEDVTGYAVIYKVKGSER
jgi:hypothetical protein